MKTILTVKEVAKILETTILVVSRHCEAGRLKGYRIPGSTVYRVPVKHLLRFMRLNRLTIPKELLKGEDMSGENLAAVSENEPENKQATPEAELTAQRDAARGQRDRLEFILFNLVRKMENYGGTDAIANVKASSEFAEARRAVLGRT